jgi:GT2 family glycosyltransferase
MSERVAETGNSPLVSIVLVNYNSGTSLMNCVRSVVKSAYPNKELIIVDNASNDNSISMLRTLDVQARILRNPMNLGFSRACNAGIAEAKGQFILVMNPDTIVDPNWLDSLVDAARRYPHAAFFQPKILLMDNSRILNSAGNMIHIAGFGVCRGIGSLDEESFQREAEICYSSGACTLARKEALSEIGLLEELFFAYGEDKDWGWRALMMGWHSIYVPSSKILHRWSPTLGRSPRKFYLLELERVLSIWKNYSIRTLILLAPVLILVESSVLLYATVKGWMKEKIRSYSDLLRVQRAVAERRRSIQAHRVIRDSAVLERFVSEIEHPYIGVAGTLFNRLISLMFNRVRKSI